MLENIEVLNHNCIRFKKEKIIYTDPFQLNSEYQDADIILITHSHYDHFSEEDIEKVKNKNTIICVTEDLQDRALALGFSKEMLIVKVIFPAIRPGIVAAAMMAFGRGLGETMAVMMVVGNSPIYPAMMGRGQTIAALTALEMGSIEYGSTHLAVLYAANAVLLVILVLVMICGRILRRMEKDE